MRTVRAPYPRKGRFDRPVVAGHDHRPGAAKAIEEEHGLIFPCGCESDPKARPYWVEARMVVREFFLAYARNAPEARESILEGLNGHLCLRTSRR